MGGWVESLLFLSYLVHKRHSLLRVVSNHMVEAACREVVPQMSAIEVDAVFTSRVDFLEESEVMGLFLLLLLLFSSCTGAGKAELTDEL